MLISLNPSPLGCQPDPGGMERVTPEQRRQYRAIGGRLALYVRQQQGGLPPVSTLLAVAADLAGEQSQLVLPLRELVSRPSFPSLAGKAGSGSGSLERQALLQSMEATFAPALIAALGEILSGFLDLPSGPTPSQNTSQPSQKPATAKFSPGSPSSTSTAHTQRSSANQDPAQPASPQSNSSHPARSRLPSLVAIAATSAVLVAGGLSVGGLWLSSRGVSASKLCAAVGLCSDQRVPSPRQQALEGAAKAEQALRRAKGLEDYRQATGTLEQLLLKLANASLTSEQDRQRQQLETIAKQARTILIEEEADLGRLNQASQAIDAAQNSSGNERDRQLNAAREALKAIPARSFSDDGANRLRAQLSALERQQSTQTDPEPTTAAPEPPSSTPPVQRSLSVPQPARALSPRTPRPTEAYRDQPLF